MASINNIILDDEPPLEEYRGMLNLRVLMVEPSVPQQKIIRAQFEDQGIFNITIVDTGEAVLATMIQEQPDLVVSAMYLPDMTGVELIHEIRTRKESSVDSRSGNRLRPPLAELTLISDVPCDRT